MKWGEKGGNMGLGCKGKRVETWYLDGMGKRVDLWDGEEGGDVGKG